MMILLKCFLALFLESALFLTIGAAARRLPLMPPYQGAASCTAAGFVLYHFLFWCAAYPCRLARLPFHIVYWYWFAVLLLLPLLAGIVFRGDLAALLRDARRCLRDDLPYVLTAAVPLLLLVLYGVTHGQIDVDSTTYISEIGTVLHTDALSGFSAATGKETTDAGLELRRGFALFGAESACWCRLLGIRAVAYCRYTRTALNYFMYAAVLFGCARVFRPVRDSLLFLTAALSFLPVFAMNIFQQGAFLLNRGYEGKAWLAGTLTALVFYLGLRYLRDGDARMIAFLFMANVACLNISASSIYMIPPVIAALMLGRLISSGKLREILYTVLILLPNLYFGLQFLRG